MPDSPGATLIVKALQAGTSETLIADQIRQQGVANRPTMNDLIYLKENKVVGVSEVDTRALTRHLRSRGVLRRDDEPALRHHRQNVFGREVLFGERTRPHEHERGRQDRG